MSAAGRVAIGICTAHRPEMLRCCLAALASQTIPEGVDLTLVAADNEPVPANQQAVAEFAVSTTRRWGNGTMQPRSIAHPAPGGYGH